MEFFINLNFQYCFFHRYEKGFRKLIANIPSAKDAFIRLASQLIKQEVSAVCKSTSPGIKSLKGQLTQDRIASFSWPFVISEAEEHIPMCVTMLRASIRSK